MRVKEVLVRTFTALTNIVLYKYIKNSKQLRFAQLIAVIACG